eukprot:gb/GECG01008368.1/.p1 GENE.gb/GECG01008368.1/~~gb/GECG01008368.1/.p1  ORF type:complete len:276 (+),score=45.43 gb/GECG01008368.1/:1-828(+)
MSTGQQSSSAARASSGSKEEDRNTHRLQRDAPRRGYDDVPEVVKEIEQSLSQFGIRDYDDSVILQLLDAYHDHAGQIKSRAELLAHHCHRTEVLDNDVHLAASMHLKSTRAQIPTTAEFDKTAQDVNSLPLDFGDPSRVQLPPRSQRGVGVDATDAKAAASRTKKATESQASGASSVSQSTSSTSQGADPFGMLSSLTTEQRSQASRKTASVSATAAPSSTATATATASQTSASGTTATTASSSLPSLAPLAAQSLHRKPEPQRKRDGSNRDADM